MRIDMKILVIVVMLVVCPLWATVSSTPFTVTYTCTGGFGPFAFTFSISDPTALQVTLNGTVLSSSSYTTVPVNNNYSNGGSVTLGGSFPCTVGQLLVLTRVTPITQTISFYDNMPIPMKTFERGLDKVTEIEQELKVNGSGAVGPNGSVQFTDGAGNFQFDTGFNFNTATKVLEVDGGIQTGSAPAAAIHFNAVTGLIELSNTGPTGTFYPVAVGNVGLTGTLACWMADRTPGYCTDAPTGTPPTCTCSH